MFVLGSGGVSRAEGSPISGEPGSAGVKPESTLVSPDTSVSESARIGVSPKLRSRQVAPEPPYRIVLRSLVYPGWGQLYNRKYFKALAVFTSEATLLGMIYSESKEASEDYDAHLVAPDPATAERLYNEYAKHFDKRDSLIWWTAGLVLLSLADAYVDAHLLTFEQEFSESRGRTEFLISAAPCPRGGFVGLSYLF